MKAGLTGGIASGKSEVSRRLADLGAVLIDADAVAREVVAPGTPGLAAIVEAFGAGVLGSGGALDRPRLGEMVFSDGAQLRRLNAIVHPLVSERMLEKERSAPPGSVLVHDVPLLTENGLAGLYDVVIVVDVPEEVQLDRLTRLRGLDPDQAKARLAAQASRDQRLAIADIVIDNSGSLAALDHQVADLWSRLTNQADEKK